MVSAQTRRGRIVSDLAGSNKPLSGAALAKELGVSRQIIVQDIALLRANGHDIVATNRGYVLSPSREPQVFTRRFKVHHGEEQTIDELENHHRSGWHRRRRYGESSRVWKSDCVFGSEKPS